MHVREGCIVAWFGQAHDRQAVAAPEILDNRCFTPTVNPQAGHEALASGLSLGRHYDGLSLREPTRKAAG